MEQFGDHLGRSTTSLAELWLTSEAHLAVRSIFLYARSKKQVAHDEFDWQRIIFRAVRRLLSATGQRDDVSADCCSSSRVACVCNVSRCMEKGSENRNVEQDEEEVLIVFVRCFRYASSKV